MSCVAWRGEKAGFRRTKHATRPQALTANKSFQLEVQEERR